MVPAWLVVPVLIAGVLVGAALGWWMRQRTLAAGAGPSLNPADEPASPPSPPGADAPSQSKPAPPVVAGPAEQTTPRPIEAPVIVVGHAVEPRQRTTDSDPVPAAAEQLRLEPQVQNAAGADFEKEPEVPAKPSERDEPAPPDDAPAVEGERLDDRMEDVLSELERRYRGRRVDPGKARDEPDSAGRPRRRRPQP